jgi:hypothetical protein
MKTNSEVDVILSTEGGIMPGTNMVLVGGPGSGKSTVALDMLSNFTHQGLKCLFISGEMDEIAHYKYCKRLPKFACVQTLFLKNYTDNVKETLEYVFNQGYDIIAVDSIAEVIEMVKDNYKTTESAAEGWFLQLQDSHKKGNNKGSYYTTFINIQQVTKQGDFAGGLDAGVDSLIGLVDGEALPAPENRAASGIDIGNILPMLLFGGLITGLILRSIFGTFLGSAINGGLIGGVIMLFGLALSAAAVFGIIAFFFTMMMGSRGLGGYSGGIGGGYGGGGWSGGGSSSWGGGGGSFGGGGASGDW